MPRCLQCNEPYADSLRRCPHCGASPHEEASPGAPVAASAAPRRVSEEGAPKKKIPQLRLALIAALLAVGGLGAVLALPGGAADDPAGAASSNTRRARASTGPRPKPRQKGIRPGKLETAVKLDEAVRIGEQVVVRGTIARNAVTRVTIDGRSVPISADGSRFQALLERGTTSFELAVRGVGDETRSERVLVNVPDGPPLERLEPTHRLDGQTFHEREKSIELAPGASAPKLQVTLDAVENFVRLGDRVVRLYRAPEGLVFLRVTATGHYAFLRRRDGQEVVLVPAGVSRRGTGEEPPHGPAHVVRMEPYLIDRTEVSGEQYAAFLAYMERVGDPSLRHRQDRGGDLRPAGWTEARCPDGAEDRPVTGVSWYGAFAYARWVGGRLPTEAQWERAAAGPWGQRFPWGQEYEPGRCVVDADRLAPARSMPQGAGPFDLLHASGNAREWCFDRFYPRWLRYASRIDPRGPAGHRHRVVRGGSYATAAERLVLQFRDQEGPDNRPTDIGFRVAMPWPDDIR